MPRLKAPAIPASRDELTAEWLDMALHSSGVLREAHVVGARSEVLGEGEGFVGLIVRLHLEFDGPEPTAPQTVVAKLPTRLAMNRALGELLGAYEREVRFYRELAAQVELATPRCYYAAMDPSPLEGREEESIRFVQGIPSWLLRWLLPVFIWLAGRSQRRYVVLLEDLQEASVGDQVAGCSTEEAERIVAAMAANQAVFWNSPQLDGRFWLADFNVFPHLSQRMFLRNRDEFFEIHRGRLGGQLERTTRIADWLGRRGLQVMSELGSLPHTLIHGDFRLDNLFFCSESANRPWLTAIDWQSVGFGRGPFDLAYFTTGNISSQALARCEVEIARHYHAALEAGGVTGYPFESCWRDYQLAKLMLLHRLISGAGLFDLSHERGEQILDRTFEGILATLPPGDLDALLDQDGRSSGSPQASEPFSSQSASEAERRSDFTSS